MKIRENIPVITTTTEPNKNGERTTKQSSSYRLKIVVEAQENEWKTLILEFIRFSVWNTIDLIASACVQSTTQQYFSENHPHPLGMKLFRIKSSQEKSHPIAFV